MPICSSSRPITAKKYLRVAFIEGVACAPSSGSAWGGAASSSCLPAPCSHSMAAMPASSRMTDTIDHIAAEVVMVLPTSGSCGQLLVYDRPGSPGRSVAAAQALQKKNAVSAARSSAAGTSPSRIAYCSRSFATEAESPNRAS